MKNKNVLLVLAGVFVMLMVGAGILYGWLGRTIRPDTAEVVPQPTAQTQPAETVEATEPENEPTEASEPQEQTQEEPQVETQEPEYVIPAPDFTAYDGDGNPVALFSYLGKPIVLNFWASWCGPCQMEMPHFEQAYLDMGEEIQFLMVNMTGGRESLKSAENFLEKTGYTFPVLFDLDLDAAYTYGAYTLPMTVFIDADGNVQDLAIGAIDEATLLSKIDKIK